MHTDSRARTNPGGGASGYATGPVTKPPNWHGLVVLDILFNNLATGLFLVAALGELALPEAFTAVATVAYPIAFVLLLADLLCLVLDLGDPWRFHHMLRVFKPSSPMSLGTWCLTVFALPLTVLAALSLLPGEGVVPAWVRGTAVIACLLPALGAAVYKGVLFSTSSQPGWKDARWLGGYFVSSAFLLGCAALLALSTLMGFEPTVAILRPALVLLLLFNLVTLALLLIDLRAPLRRACTPGALWRIGAIVLGVGVLAPLGLLMAGSPLLLLGAVICIVLGALAVRVEIVRWPQVLGRV